MQIFDPASGHWYPSHKLNSGLANAIPPPKPRHSHLSSVTLDRLFIIGGQDLRNVWLDDVYVYDLWEKAWIRYCCYPRHYGTYLTVAAAADQCVRIPGSGGSAEQSNPGLSQTPRSSILPPSPTSSLPPQSLLSPLSLAPSTLYSPTSPPVPVTSNFQAVRPPHSDSANSRSGFSSHLPYSAPPTDDYPCNVYLYSNYNV